MIGRYVSSSAYCPVRARWGTILNVELRRVWNCMQSSEVRALNSLTDQGSAQDVSLTHSRHRHYEQIRTCLKRRPKPTIAGPSTDSHD